MIKPTLLIILDGWGIAPPGPGNAISLAKLTNIPRYWASFPHAKLIASGEGVGLPSGEPGNTETGHINIGAGRVVYQDLPRISMSVGDNSFYKNEAFTGAIAYAKEYDSNLHLMGLLSDSSVHASRNHLYALCETVKKSGYDKPVYIHLMTDGRDSPPNAAIRFIDEVEKRLKEIGVGTIATILGRYYGMDRDRRWERTEVAYKALTEIIDKKASSAKEAIEISYKKLETDEFIKPTIIVDKDNKPYPRISNKDAVIFYNYRIDRPRQLTRALVVPDFEAKPQPVSFDPYAVNYFHKHVAEFDALASKPFQRNVVMNDLFFVTMTEYERNLPCVVAFPPQPVKMTLGRVYAEAGKRQLRVAETEKERFVTYYFNGVREDPYRGEDHLIIPSPKVETYDLKPEMSIFELTEKLLGRITIGVYSLFIINIANPDMVGHTGNIKAAIRACEVTDECVGKIVANVMAKSGTCIITGDHGNVEEMLGPEGEMDTEHSTFPVPFIMIDKKLENCPTVLPAGRLGDIAPTLLAFNGMQIPDEMTGKNLMADFQLRR